MQMEAGLDTGPMIQKVETPIMPSDTGGSLHDRLMDIGSQAVVDVVNKITSGPVLKEIQDDSLSCYAHKLKKKKLSSTGICQRKKSFKKYELSTLSPCATPCWATAASEYLKHRFIHRTPTPFRVR